MKAFVILTIYIFFQFPIMAVARDSDLQDTVVRTEESLPPEHYFRNSVASLLSKNNYHYDEALLQKITTKNQVNLLWTFIFYPHEGKSPGFIFLNPNEFQSTVLALLLKNKVSPKKFEEVVDHLSEWNRPAQLDALRTLDRRRVDRQKIKFTDSNVDLAFKIPDGYQITITKAIPPPKPKLRSLLLKCYQRLSNLSTGSQD